MERNPQKISRDEALEILSASLDGEATLEEIDALAAYAAAHPDFSEVAEALEADDGRVRQPGPRPAFADSPRSWRWAAAAALVAAATGFTLLNGPAAPPAPKPAAEAQLADELDRLTDEATALMVRLRGSEAAPPRDQNPFLTGSPENPFLRVHPDRPWRSR